MKVSRVDHIAGMTVVELDEDSLSPLWFTRPVPGFVFCREINQVRWSLTIVAHRVLAQQTLHNQLVEMARRVGVEYTPTQQEATDERN